MESYDVIVIGSGSGLDVGSAAARRGLKVAIVEKDPIGGTCLNRGCVPSKMLIHRADVAEQIQQSEQFGITASIDEVAFAEMVEEVNAEVSSDSKSIARGLRNSPHHHVYQTVGKFVDERTLEVGDETIQGHRVIVAAGSRPAIPPIAGIHEVEYITSKEALKLKTRPNHLVIIGGGFIAAEMGHFFGTFGSDVTIIGRRDVLLPDEDSEISTQFTERFQKKYEVKVGYEATAVSQEGSTFSIHAKKKEGNTIEVKGDELLVAAGRKPNTDILEVEKGGIDTDEKGFVKTNEYLETTAENVWALGDIAGNFMFKHSANLEAEYVFYNAFTEHRHKINYTAMPHVVFSSPQVASVGKTERELEEKDVEYLANKYEYSKTAMGQALKEKHGFVKVLISPQEGNILGCHIIGPHASMLIHEVEILMRSGGTVHDMRDAIIAHPALSEVIQRVFTTL